MYVDSHAHLEMEQFDADRDQMLQRAQDAGVQTILAIGSGTGPGTPNCCSMRFAPTSVAADAIRQSAM